MKESFGDRLVHIAITAILIIIAVVMVLPLYYVIVVSVTDPVYYLQTEGKVFFPSHFSLDAFKVLLSTKAIPTAFGVTVYITVIGTVLSIIVNAGLSYAVSRKRLRGRKFIMAAIMLTMIFQPGIVPPYLLVRNLGMIDSLWSLILPVLTSGWYVILMKGFFDGIPASLEEAALIDGCNDMTIWFKIILPLSLPSIAAFSLFYAVGYWNTYLSAVFYINKAPLWPLQVVVRNILNVATATSSEAASEIQGSMPSEMLQTASVVVAMLPILTVYPFLQKHFTQGAMLGAIKE